MTPNETEIDYRSVVRYYHPDMVVEARRSRRAHLYQPGHDEAICGHQRLSIPGVMVADLPYYRDLLAVSKSDADHAETVPQLSSIDREIIDLKGFIDLLPLPAPEDDDTLCLNCQKMWAVLNVPTPQLVQSSNGTRGRVLAMRSRERDRRADRPKFGHQPSTDGVTL